MGRFLLEWYPLVLDVSSGQFETSGYLIAYTVIMASLLDSMFCNSFKSSNNFVYSSISIQLNDFPY